MLDPEEAKNFPASHIWQVVAPALTSYWPAGQLTQADDPEVAENWPDGQFEQSALDAAPEKARSAPAGQEVQLVDPGWGAYLPRSQSEHALKYDSTKVENFPETHPKQLLAPLLG